MRGTAMLQHRAGAVHKGCAMGYGSREGRHSSAALWFLLLLLLLLRCKRCRWGRGGQSRTSASRSPQGRAPPSLTRRRLRECWVDSRCGDPARNDCKRYLLLWK